MAEDALRLREEVAVLKKEILVLNKNKEALNQVIENLHKEQMQYLNTIPTYKKQAYDAIQNTVEPVRALNELKEKVIVAQKEFNSLQENIVKNEVRLQKLRSEQNKIIKEANEAYDSVNNSRASLKDKEVLIAKREQDCVAKEEFNKKISFDLDRREVALVNKEKELTQRVNDLQNKIDEHVKHVDSHGKKVDTLIEQKQFLSEDQQILKEKTESVNRLIKDNVDIKAAMLKQAEKMDDETKKAEAKQVALDRAINDLKNEEKRIKIMELKVIKMAKDAGIEKELKDLMESLK